MLEVRGMSRYQKQRKMQSAKSYKKKEAERRKATEAMKKQAVGTVSKVDWYRWLLTRPPTNPFTSCITSISANVDAAS